MIRFDEENNVFILSTPNTSYVFGISCGLLGHMYYGKRIEDTNIGYMLKMGDEPHKVELDKGQEVPFLDSFPNEYSSEGIGDYRENCISIKNKYGEEALKLRYNSHRIYKGKAPLEGLPHTFGKDCDTLEVELVDEYYGVRVMLTYSVFCDVDAITRSVRIVNTSKDSLIIKKALSASLSIDTLDEYDVITLHGAWGRERNIQRIPLSYGNYVIGSKRGESSQQEHPFMAVVSKNTTQESGEVYAMNFVYSGNFIAKVGKDCFDTARMVMGIHPEHFSWKLNEGEEFVTPEVVMVYSANGLDDMTKTFHDLYRKHLIRSKWKDVERPVLINNWEGTYFDFNEEKLYTIAKEANERGVELFVMDDGWFGKRNDDRTSLGDWYVNEDKLKGGLKNLVDRINALGMKFGMWFEPEMVSEDSTLYREHPDWILGVRGRKGAKARYQYVLDFSREEVMQAVYEQMKKVLTSANIEYIKWDMNRPLSDVANTSLEPDRQGEISHRYMLNVYKMQEMLITDFPNILLENCSSGGARFDAGMLYYSPQIWCSDDIDPIERLAIHEGTALVYPLSTIGSHVAVSPNHTTNRETPFDTRGIVAEFGTFGYELDVTKLPKEDKEKITEQIAEYKRYNHITRDGDYYRIASYRTNNSFDAYEMVTKDKKEAIMVVIQVKMQPNRRGRVIKFKGLDSEATYIIEGKLLKGATLMNVGIVIDREFGDNKAKIIYIREQSL